MAELGILEACVSPFGQPLLCEAASVNLLRHELSYRAVVEQLGPR